MTTWLARLVLLFSMLAGETLHAQKSIPADKELLKKGEGAGMAAYADLNGYPGPKHILDMEEKLNLSEEQRKDVQSIYDAMEERAKAIGDAIVAKEIELEKMFASGKANETETKKHSREIGTLRGELRGVHLVAHIQARQVLTREQGDIYNSARHGTRRTGHGK